MSSNTTFSPNNGAILTIKHIIKNVMTSAAEAELGSLYIASREAVYIQIILKELGHKQPKIPIQTDNSTSEGVINNKIQPKRTKSMGMRLYWLRDQEYQKELRFYWRPGPTNHDDYWTKHHPTTHHKNRPDRISDPNESPRHTKKTKNYQTKRSEIIPRLHHEQKQRQIPMHIREGV